MATRSRSRPCSASSTVIHPIAVVCLGDLIQGGPDPGRCADLVQERGWPVVLGNADAFVLDEASAASGVEGVTERQLAQRAWTLEQLSADQRAFVVLSCPPWSSMSGRGRCSRATPCRRRSTRSYCRRPPRRSSARTWTASRRTSSPPATCTCSSCGARERRSGSTRAASVSRTTTISRRTTSASTRGRPTGLSRPTIDGRFAVELRRIPVDLDAIVARVEAAGCRRLPTARGAGSRASNGKAPCR